MALSISVSRKQETARVSQLADGHDEIYSSSEQMYEKELEVDERELTSDRKSDVLESDLKNLRDAMESAKCFNQRATEHATGTHKEEWEDMLKQKEEEICTLKAQSIELSSVIHEKEQYANELETKKVEAELSFQTVQRDLARESLNMEVLMHELAVRDTTLKQDAEKMILLIKNHDQLVASLKEKHEHEIELLRQEVKEHEQKVNKRAEHMELHLHSLRDTLESANRFNETTNRSGNFSSTGDWKDVVRQKEDKIHKLEVELTELTGTMEQKQQNAFELEKLRKHISVKELKVEKLQQLMNAKDIKMKKITRNAEELTKKCAELEHQLLEKNEVNAQQSKQIIELQQRQQESHKLFENTSRRARELHKMVTSSNILDNANKKLVEQVRQLQEKNAVLLSEAEKREIALDVAINDEKPCVVCEETQTAREREMTKSNVLFDEARAASRAEVARAELRADELRTECTELSEKVSNAHKLKDELEDSLGDQLWQSQIELEQVSFEGTQVRSEHELAARQLEEANKEIGSLVEIQKQYQSQKQSAVLQRLADESGEREKMAYREEAREAIEELVYWQKKCMVDGDELLSAREEMQLMQQSKSSATAHDSKLSTIEGALRRENRQMRIQLRDVQNTMDSYRKQEVGLRTEIIKVKTLATEENNALRRELNAKLAENEEEWNQKYADLSQKLVEANKNLQTSKLKAAVAEKRVISLMHWIRSIKAASEASLNGSVLSELQDVIQNAYLSLDGDHLVPPTLPIKQIYARQISGVSADPRSFSSSFSIGSVGSSPGSQKWVEGATRKLGGPKKTSTTSVSFLARKAVEKSKTDGTAGKQTPTSQRDAKAPRRRSMASVRKMKLADRPLRSNLRKASPSVKRHTMIQKGCTAVAEFAKARHTHQSVTGLQANDL